MIVRSLMLLAAAAAIVSPVLAGTARADNRDVLHHCEDVLARAAKTANSTKTPLDTGEIERCRIVVRESALRDSRMTVDESGKTVR